MQRFGEWDDVVETIAHHCRIRPRDASRWSMWDGLTAFREIVKSYALEDYRHETTVWALLAPHQKRPEKAPALPDILRSKR